MHSHTGVIEAIDAGEQEIRDEAKLRIKEIEGWRDLELGRLERTRLALLGSRQAPEKSVPERIDPPPKSRHRGRRRKRSSMSVADRRENVFRFVGESAKPVSSGEIARALDMSSYSVHTALRQLLKERKIVRLGNSALTRYAVRTGLPTLPVQNSGQRGTLQGRIVTTIKDRGYASAEELGQTLGEPVDRVLEACGALQVEEEIHMSRRGGKAVYMGHPAA